MYRSSNFYCDLLKLCCEARDQELSRKLHCHILRTLKNPETFIFNKLIDTYAKLGNMGYARHTFDQMPQPNIFSWNTILSTYSKSGCLYQMEEIFNRMPQYDEISWNVFISGHASFGSLVDTVRIYSLMLGHGTTNLNHITLSTMLILSSNKMCLQLGKQVHGQIIKFGFEQYMFVGSPLVDMYSEAEFIFDAKQVFDEMGERNLVVYNTMLKGLLRCGLIEYAKSLFHKMPEKDSISWTTMITGLNQNGFNKEAIITFQEMRLEGMSLDQYTFGSVLTACGGLLALDEGKQIHAYIIRTCHMENIYLGSSLVNMYCKCRSKKYAETVFKRMLHKNLVSWTAMLVGYGQNGYSEEAVRTFCDMQRNGVKPDDFTLGSVIKSCANLASLEEGAQFHCQALVSGLIFFIIVSNALVSLYGKCGSIDDSHFLFNEMKVRNEVSWTALVSGYAQFGKANESIELFETMLVQGFRPDEITFIGVLSACSRAGLVEKGKHYFELMVKKHEIMPISDHYTCMIDLLGRAGRLEEAKDYIGKMPYKPDAIGWATLLSSCRLHQNVEIGKWAAQCLLELEPQNPASYMLLSKIYAAKGKWDDVAKLRRKMRDTGVKKEPGFSWIKYKSKLHVFSADDQSSPFSDQINDKLEQLYQKMIQEGYAPDTSSVHHDVQESEKMKMLNHHSEKLAIAFGLIFIPPGVPIRVVKNLRVCGDCHNATKYISKITKREILVRDSVRYHLFKDGRCSCGDFW